MITRWLYYSASDNYFANQYSTDENSTQPVPVDFNQYHKLKHVFLTVQLMQSLVLATSATGYHNR